MSLHAESGKNAHLSWSWWPVSQHSFDELDPDLGEVLPARVLSVSSISFVVTTVVGAEVEAFFFFVLVAFVVVVIVVVNFAFVLSGFFGWLC
jgi:hypothetical protein